MIRPSSRGSRYAAPLLFLAAMVAVRILLERWLGHQDPFALLYPATAVAVWLGGAGPALVCAIVGYVLGDLLFASPGTFLTFRSGAEAVEALSYAVASLSIIGIGHVLRSARIRSDEAARAAELQNRDLGAEIRRRKEAEEAFRDAAARLELAYEAGGIGSFDWDLATDRAVWSSHLKRIFGVPEQTPSNLPSWWRGHVHPDDRSRVEEEITSHVARGGDRIYEFRIVRADDARVRWLESRAHVDLDAAGRATRMAGVVVDITERKGAEEALRENESRFRALAELVPCCVWSAAPDGSITYANRRWYEFSGLSVDGPAGLAWAEVLHPEDRAHCLDAWQTAVQQGIHYRIEVRNRRFDGEYRWLLTEAMPVRDESGRITAWFGTSTDIHDQKMAEESLRRADRRKNEFLAILGHEIRNPLSVIANAVALLDQIGSKDDHVVRTRQMIRRQVGHLTRIMDDLLDVSRVVEGKVRLRREPTPVALVVNSAVEAALPYLESREQRLRISLPSEPLWIHGDVTRMTQVLGNLLQNAGKFSDKPGQVHLAATRRGDNVALTVRDSGVGIGPEVLPRIFDLFVQGDQSVRRSRGGLGIGLTLVRRLVELHGGAITARSEGPGKGSEFTIVLPAIPAPERSEKAPASQLSPPGPSSVRVLVVDDNEDSVESLALVLSLSGHHVATAASGPEARKIAREFRPDVVLLDIGMPETDGYEVARWIRAEPELKDAYLVAVTGYGQEQDRRRSREAGFDEHLVKPVDPATLEKAISATRRTPDGGASRARAAQPDRAAAPPVNPLS